MSLAEALRRLPKVELHCHVEGTMRPSTVMDLARRNSVPLPTEDVTQLYRYGSLDEFLSVFWLVQSVLCSRGDWARLGHESVLDGAAAGRVYAETFFTPARHLAAGQSLADVVAGLAEGVAAADSETGCRTALVCDMDRAFGAAAGLQLVEELVALRRASAPGAELVIGVGMDSTELGVDPLSFAPAYAAARAGGLRLTGHQGEDTPASAIALLLDEMAVERIDHGLSAAQDPVLVHRLVQDQVPVTMCPTSNVVIANRVPSVAEHPFPHLRALGLLLSLNTDDPALLDLDPAREYALCAEAWDYGFDEMVAVSLDGVASTWLSDEEKRALSDRVTAAADALRPELG